MNSTLQCTPECLLFLNEYPHIRSDATAAALASVIGAPLLLVAGLCSIGCLAVAHCCGYGDEEMKIGAGAAAVCCGVTSTAVMIAMFITGLDVTGSGDTNNRLYDACMQMDE